MSLAPYMCDRPYRLPTKNGRLSPTCLSSTPNRLLLPDSSAGSALQALTITISRTPSRRISAAGVVWMLLLAVGCPARACCCRFMAACLLATDGRSKVGYRLFRVNAQPNELPESLAGWLADLFTSRRDSTKKKSHSGSQINLSFRLPEVFQTPKNQLRTSLPKSRPKSLGFSAVTGVFLLEIQTLSLTPLEQNGGFVTSL
uniref:(northern house mosquito) hypothetical protein n=1 Tax=Culex pipiens TaxID=7175 RepID=A0A8D8KMF3_CULPI